MFVHRVYSASIGYNQYDNEISSPFCYDTATFLEVNL